MGLNIFGVLGTVGSFAGDFKTILIKVGIITSILGLLGGGAFLFYKWSEHRSDVQIAAAIAAAHNQGISDANSATANAANAQMVQAIQNIEKLTEATNAQMANIRITTQVNQKAIDHYDVQTTGVDHPEQVETWANQTTSQLFEKIQAASNPSATPTPPPSQEASK